MAGKIFGSEALRAVPTRPWSAIWTAFSRGAVGIRTQRDRQRVGVKFRTPVNMGTSADPKADIRWAGRIGVASPRSTCAIRKFDQRSTRALESYEREYQGLRKARMRRNEEARRLTSCSVRRDGVVTAPAS